MQGWIKLHRKLIENPIFRKPHMLQLLIYCVLKANHDPGKAFWGKDEIMVERGQFITGRFELSTALNQPPNTTYARLKRLENGGILYTKSNNKNTLVTVVNYELYQSEESKDNIKNNNKITTNEQQNNTNKNVRMKECKKKDIYIDLLESYTQDKNLKKSLEDFIIMRKNIKSPMTERALKLLFGELNKLSSSEECKVRLLEQSILNNWKSVYPLKENKKNATKSTAKHTYNDFENKHDDSIYLDFYNALDEGGG